MINIIVCISVTIEPEETLRNSAEQDGIHSMNCSEEYFLHQQELS
jgi:hypothetical protein